MGDNQPDKAGRLLALSASRVARTDGKQSGRARRGAERQPSSRQRGGHVGYTERQVRKDRSGHVRLHGEAHRKGARKNRLCRSAGQRTLADRKPTGLVVTSAFWTDVWEGSQSCGPGGCEPTSSVRSDLGPSRTDRSARTSWTRRTAGRYGRCGN